MCALLNPNERKAATPARACGALVLGAAIGYAYWYALHTKWAMLEARLHSGQHVNPLLLLLFPLSAIALLLLLVPLLMYVVDHAAFSSLAMPRPDHYLRLLCRVYTAWLSAEDGKLKEKDL